MPTMIRTRPAKTVTVTVDGRQIEVSAGISVAAGLMEAGIVVFRQSPITRAPRAPFCMMGVCFDCLMTIDGLDNQQACQLEIRDGMVIERHLDTSGSPDGEGGHS